MPSTHDDSSGTPGAATPRHGAPETAAKTDPLADLIARSDRAVDTLLATTDWDAVDAGLARLAAESDAAMRHYHLLVQQRDNAFTPGTGPGVPSVSEGDNA